MDNVVVAWILSLIMSVAPMGTTVTPFEAAREAPEAARERYESIARDLVEVAYDESERPLFPGPFGRAKTVAVLLAIAKYESSGYRRDIDLGIGPNARGDHGRSWCLGQINLGRPRRNGKTPRRLTTDAQGMYAWAQPGEDGFSGPELVQNRDKCFRAMLWMVRTSFAICGKKTDDPTKWLALYTSGKCHKGIVASRERVRLGLRWARGIPTVTDKVVIAELRKRKQEMEASVTPPYLRYALNP